MAVNKVPVLKRCRSLNLDPVFLGYDKKSNRTCARANKKMSEYGLQLREKQKANIIYGVLETPFRKHYEKADRMKGMTGENLMVMLETRLDNLVYRLGFAATRRQARQLVNHGHITLDGKKADIPSMLVNPGQKIALKESSRGLQIVKDALEATVSRVPFVSFDENTNTGTFVRLPERSEILPDIKENLIVEFYNK